MGEEGDGEQNDKNRISRGQMRTEAKTKLQDSNGESWCVFVSFFEFFVVVVVIIISVGMR